MAWLSNMLIALVFGIFAVALTIAEIDDSAQLSQPALVDDDNLPEEQDDLNSIAAPEKRAPMDRFSMVRFGKRAPMDRSSMVRFGRSPMDRSSMVRFGKRSPMDRSSMVRFGKRAPMDRSSMVRFG